MSMIRRINAAQRLDENLNKLRKDGDVQSFVIMAERIKKLLPRGANNSLENNGIINTQHYGAAALLQNKPVGQVVRVVWESKKGQIMHGTYVRQGFRANISRKWLAADAWV